MKYYIIGALVVVVFFIVQSIRYRKENEKKMKKIVEESWGSTGEAVFSADEYEAVKGFFKETTLKEDEYEVDSITANDIDLERLYKRINHNFSSVGDEVLYKILLRPSFRKELLEKREQIISYFQGHKEMAFEVQKEYMKLGRVKRVSFYKYITALKNLSVSGNGKNYLCIILLFLMIGSFFISSALGAILLVLVLGYNITSYYSQKGTLDNYLICIAYLVGLCQAGDKIAKLNIPVLEEEKKSILDATNQLSKITSKIGYLGSGAGGGSLGDMVFDYIRMMTHIDLIIFNNILKEIPKYLPVIEELYDCLGNIEALISVASFRESLPYYGVPEFKKTDDYLVEELYHPLVESPVANSLKEKRSVLLTGSNASGKSTFLKSVALNAIFAQSIHTVMAKTYVTDMYEVYSSMALHDNLEGEESYFIVEIRSLKRIIDKEKSKHKIMGFVDEVLRGTNTVERIAASSCILENMAKENLKIFAATHDIELTDLLKEDYSNYHFEEEVKDQDVLFDYHLKSGKAMTRNAIALLNITGYDKDLVNKAKKKAEEFMVTGTWS